MHCLFLLLTAFIAITNAASLPKRNDYGLEYKEAPGPIPYLDPAVRWPAVQSVTPNAKHLGLPDNLQANLTECLVQYSMGRFYDSWDGNVCGGYGWFKGPPGSGVGTYDCYQTCATWIQYDGIEKGATDYHCDYGRKMSRCWMGYHPVENDVATA